MEKMKTKIVFFGTGKMSLECLKAIENDYQLVAVVTKPDSVSPNKTVYISPLKKYALAKNILVLTPQKVEEINPQLVKLNPEVGVLVAYGKIIPLSTINLFPKGIVNVHGSILPKYRGASPIESVILNGETQTGVSLMLINTQLDAGPIIATKRIKIDPLITKNLLQAKITALAKSILTEKLALYLQGKIKPKPQDDSQATYTKLIKKADGKLDFNQSKLALERQIRAYQGWPGSFFEYQGKKIEIIEAKISEVKNTPGKLFRLNKDLAIGTKDGSLVISQLKPEGKKVMTGKDFLNGHQEIK